MTYIEINYISSLMICNSLSLLMDTHFDLSIQNLPIALTTLYTISQQSRYNIESNLKNFVTNGKITNEINYFDKNCREFYYVYISTNLLK